jgi:hypothetical protein
LAYAWRQRGRRGGIKKGACGCPFGNEFKK